MENIDVLTDWSRAQFALTALYHWLFVPLTLGLTFIVAIMETIYVKTGDIWWKNTTKFWMGLLAINFAIGLATGIIMEFEFGTNWSNYSWIVGDIFGAPLAIEGIMAFFLESTFFAVMFFGWDKVSKKMHLLSTWLVAVGSNLSALWILVANGWMQNPVGMKFNPDTARNEMVDFWEVLFNPNAYSKFLHTVSSGYVLASLFVIAVSSWYILKRREIKFAKRSIVVAASFGLITSLFMLATGDESAHRVALNQPMKLAAMEGIYKGRDHAGIVAVGILNPEKEVGDDKDTFLFEVEIPYALSFLGYHKIDAYVPGIDDLVYGNEKLGIMSASEKIERGKEAVAALSAYKEAKKAGNEELAQDALNRFEANSAYLGYGYLNDPKEVVPNVPITFYAFHIMVGFGSWFIALFFIILYFAMTNDLDKKRWILWAAVISLPLGYIAQEAGWIVAEVGRQPWAIQDMLPVGMATSNMASTNVIITFWMFAILFTALLIAEVKIMAKQISIGPKEH
ncbi:cytochrome ubiquinol oxidase subunit I [Hydrogenimonas thermophila]|uniref:cytochrome ubiquinol oxidase subunit I n=1 Tax=Hydrogenimonas thermophila TaxID=223786 RepID=UPI002936E6CB|nr:cytochrome ubiquinol oxidase subunit I [Hydrogenimonas thermophila]WOE69156.1 cytochrome ubiquinol oxidase subunit I [Hydrogenimonas thermophila]WOE71666.1 cytochrome ubiquinol oxidase subunit I [Hydrogenimonas thermophila]